MVTKAIQVRSYRDRRGSGIDHEGQQLLKKGQRNKGADERDWGGIINRVGEAVKSNKLGVR